MTWSTRDIVQDLLTVYLAGDASDDTRRLVESYLATDPVLAAAVANARTDRLDLPDTPATPPTAEKRALDATRQLLKTRSSTLVVACLFSVLPLSFAFDASGVTARDAPVLAAAWWATAAVMWVVHASVRRRVRVPGL